MPIDETLARWLQAQRDPDQAKRPGSLAMLTQLERDALEPSRVQVLTPLPIARWLALRAINEPTTVLDPAAGTGRLLIAALERLVALGEPAERALGRLRGFEIDPLAAKIARSALVARAVELGASEIALDMPDIQVADALSAPAESLEAGAILLNPPYLNADRLSDAHHDALRARLPFYRRQLDQSIVFVALAIDALEPGGTLAAITPRYWLEATGAGPFRQWLAARTDLDLIADLGNFQVWPKVNVLCTLLVASAGRGGGDHEPTRLVRPSLDPRSKPPDPAQTAIDAVNDALTRERDVILIPPDKLRQSPWTFRPPRIEATLARLEAAATHVADWFHVGQGVKTGRNATFVVDAERAKSLGLPDSLLRLTAKTRDLSPYAVASSSERLLLVLDDTPIHDHPALEAYLQSQREALLARYQVRKNKAAWFALSLPQNLSLLGAPEKILTPLYARTNTFALDRHQRIARTDLYALAPRRPLPLPIEAFVAMLNSAPARLFARSRAKLKRDGYLEFGGRLLASIPLPLDAEGALLPGADPEDLERLVELSALALDEDEDAQDQLDAICWSLFVSSDRGNTS